MNPFYRQAYIIEFRNLGMEVEMMVNGALVARRRASKAVCLGNWVSEVLNLPVLRKNSWSSIEDALTVHGYTLSPAYYTTRGGKLSSYYAIICDSVIPVDNWPLPQHSDKGAGT